MLRIHHARHFWQRALGLLGRRALAADEALLIRPCTSIHTFGMRFAIDVVFLDREGRVRAVHPALPPWRAVRCRGAHAVLELAAGGAARAGIERGQKRPALLGDTHRSDDR
ncbi:MAG TPA: DUF192 domain-containing protein [Thauera sp.]|uniref:DUF192 domain-containing protein n=1 Tax=Thauera sp. TaxID=1905334 RepID=UPI002D19302E|nr:DUF192 domain-containing protein [Thauera sp.]HRP26446.1 DUF192 domain-containing protein [Thauera sp.]HRP67038.1 DUF192 domain-containing protein [Thauera sp.]